MLVRMVNNYVRFGDLKGIRCEDSFSQNNPKHLAAIGEMLNNPAFDEFGKAHDYVAEFSTYSIHDIQPVYKLSLVPVHSRFEEVQSEPDKPQDLEKRLNIIYCSSQNSENNAYNSFIERLKTIKLDDLNNALIGRECKDINSSKNPREQLDMNRIKLAADNALATLKERGIPFVEEE